jgi:hypothetical protein
MSRAPRSRRGRLLLGGWPARILGLVLLAGPSLAEDLTLPADVILRADRSLTSLKAGTVVEVISRDEKTVTVRYHGQASIRVFKDLTDPGADLQTVAAGVVKSGPSAGARLLKDTNTDGLILDFMMFAPPSAEQPFAEWNLMRAKYLEGTGLVVYQYAVRYYTFGAETGAKVNAERMTMMTPFGSATFQEE